VIAILGVGLASFWSFQYFPLTITPSTNPMMNIAADDRPIDGTLMFVEFAAKNRCITTLPRIYRCDSWYGLRFSHTYGKCVLRPLDKRAIRIHTCYAASFP
jgi:hypothetical protein